jgi:hypothetical protein
MDRRAKAVKHGPAFGHEFAAGIPDDGTTPRKARPSMPLCSSPRLR